MKVLVHLTSKGFVQHFENLIRELLARDHEVVVAFEERSAGCCGNPDELLAGLARAPGFSSVVIHVGTEPSVWFDRYGGLLKDFCWSLDRRTGPDSLSVKCIDAKVGETGKIRALRRSRILRRLTTRTINRIEEAAPESTEHRILLEENRPDVVVVSPGVAILGVEAGLMRAARRRGIPVVAAVASWGNLTTRGRLRGTPDGVLVWNEPQARELIDVHNQDPAVVHVVGAHMYDDWFERQPSRSCEEFLDEVGLPSTDSLVVYVCSVRTTESAPAPVRRTLWWTT